MRFSWIIAALPVACLAGAGPLGGCGSFDDDAQSSGANGGDGAGGSLVAHSIKLDDDKTIDMKPGEVVTIRAQITPADRGAVGFALLGDSADAALDATIVKTGSDGVAETKLHAPSQATTFQLRVTLLGGDPGATQITDTVSVAVSKHGFATLELLPQYGGLRHVTEWNATAIARTNCAALAPTLPEVPPGGLETSAKVGHSLVIHDVPVGPAIAVVVRAGHFAWGCADSPTLVPKGETPVGVAVTDAPIDLAATKLDFQLAFMPDPTELGQVVADALAVVDDAVFDDGPDATWLLDHMQTIASGDFYGARTAGGWDMLATQHFMQNNLDLRSMVEGWVEAGIEAQPSTLSVLVEGSDELAQSLEAKLTVQNLGSFSAAQAGFPKHVNVSWNAQANDVLSLGGELSWRPSALACAGALAGAKMANPTAITVDQALAQRIDCAGLASVLGGYDACDTNCLTLLCGQALAVAWSHGATASAAGAGQFTVSISGTAKVDDHAAPAKVDGQWLGVLDDGVAQASVMGPASASKTGSQSPP